eukprot:Phypoly_transcript_05345.p1 GENE.Phypoly_transcript_05345~~Phypoly_transcript_05345.p1  ORF type:complete len:610 (-),score=59.52 Phypoly_transcript_05345:54-1883(-)
MEFFKHGWWSVLWVVLILVVQLVNGQDTISFTVGFSGGTASCTNGTCANNETYVTDFACNNGPGWNGGTVSFMDPIPPNSGFVLLNITATAYGKFDCNGTNPQDLLGIIIIEGHIAADAVLPTGTGQCSCPKCVSSAYFQSNAYDNGFANYEYGVNNTLEFQSFSELPVVVCVSHIVLTFAYGPTHYSVSDISPRHGPYTGGTTVTVIGENFEEASSPICSFGNDTSEGFMVNSSVITCTAPPSSCHTFPCNVTVEISEVYMGFTYNHINFTYTKQVEPNNNKSHDPQLLWVYVAVGVCGGSVILVVAAGYIYAKRNTNKSARFVDEQSRLINSEKFKKYGSLHPIDISEILISQRIGRGSCAEVYMGVWRGTTVAIKKAKVFADDDEEFFTELAQEAEIMSALRHPNVLQFLGTASSPPELVIVMEFMSRGSLYRIIHDKSIELPWTRIKHMALDIAKGMNYLHCSDPIIIHRDLKSHNLLVDEHFKVKVCDFGLSTMVKRHLDKFTAMTPVGTPCWTAPEVLRNEPYTERADVFSFGVVMWELVTREDPYHGMPTFQIVIAVGQHNMRPIIPPNVSPTLTALITQCWSEDPSLRPPFSEIVNRLEKM